MRKDTLNGNGKSKMTVMMFQLEGSDDALREGIKTISQAIGNVVNPPRLQAIKPAVGLPTAVAVDDSATAPPDPDLPESPDEEADDIAPARVNGGPRKLRTPQILDLDLRAAPVSLKEFCEQKAPDGSDVRRYLAIAFWLKQHFKIDAVTMDHMHTCYRFLDLQTPADASSPLRFMKKRNWFNKGAEKGSYAINHIGENQIIGEK